MTDPRNRTPVPELTTARTGGGASKWLVAVGALAILGSVIYLGVAGRNPPTPAMPSNNPAAQALPTPSAAGVTPSLAPTATPSDEGKLTEVQEVLGDPGTPKPASYLGLVLSFAGEDTIALLSKSSTAGYFAAYRIPLDQPLSQAQLRIVDVGGPDPDFATLGSWSVPMTLFGQGEKLAQRVVLSANSPADTSEFGNLSAPVLVRNGFSIYASAERRPTYGLLSVFVTIWPDPLGHELTSERYQLTLTAPDGNVISSPLRPDYDGHLEGTVSASNLPAKGRVTLSLGKTDMGYFDWWEVDLADLRKARGTTDLGTITVPSAPDALNLPTLYRAGFTMKLSGARKGDVVTLSILITPGVTR